VLVGWSMGVQLGFETIKRHQHRVRALYAINGTFGRTFHTVLGSRLVGQTIPMLLRLVRAQAALVGRASKRVAGSSSLISMMQRVGVVSRDVDVESCRAIVAGFLDLDWVVYSDLLTRLDQHDAEDVLPRVAIPVTIVTGDKDVLTPRATAEHIHRMIPSSRLVVIRGGTHYTPLEYPGILVDELRRWLARVPGWEPRTASRAS
jgi:pimeloyl-ACP methyl ester carboxylesterase